MALACNELGRVVTVPTDCKSSVHREGGGLWCEQMFKPGFRGLLCGGFLLLLLKSLDRVWPFKRKEGTSLGKRKYRESLPKRLSGRAGTEKAT